MKPSFLIFFVLLVIILTGCVSTPKSVLITAERNPDFSSLNSNTISIAIHQNPSREDTFLGVALMAEMSKSHFNIITNGDADYILTYYVEDNSTEVYSKHTEVEPMFAPPPQTTSQMTSGPFLGQPFNGPGIYQVHTVSTPLIFTDKNIRLYLFTNPKHSKGFHTAWQGYIGGGTSVTKERIPFLLKTLFSYFGQDYTGKIDLKKESENSTGLLKH